METFYDLLEAKAKNPETRDKIAFIEEVDLNYRFTYHHKMTYQNMLSCVNEKIEKIKKFNRTLGINKKNTIKKYIVVENNIDSIALIIALLKLGLTPFVIDSKNVETYDFYKHGYITEPLIEMHLDESTKKYIDEIEANSEKRNLEEHSLFICSSGSESNVPHFNYLKEEDLIKYGFQYGEDGSKFYSYISCANISGILTNLVNPLVHNTTALLSNNFDFNERYFKKTVDENVKEYEIKEFYLSKRNSNIFGFLAKLDVSKYDFEFEDKKLIVKRLTKASNKTYIEKPEDFNNLDYESRIMIGGTILNLVKDRKPNDLFRGAGCYVDTLMLPRNILTLIEDGKFNYVDLSTLNHIYMAGGMNSLDVVKKLRAKFPTIKPNVFENLYGSTEANGVICSCNEKDFKVCYINLTNYKNDEIIYTYDKINFYQIKNGETKKISCKFDIFEFAPYLNVSSKREDNVITDDKLNISFIKKSETYKTGDMGIYIDDKLYILGRKKQFIEINEKYYFLDIIEKQISYYCGVDVYCINNNGLFSIYIHDKNYDFKTLMLAYENIVRYIYEIANLKFTVPVVINDSVFPMSKISGKISKKKLTEFDIYSEYQYDNVMNFNENVGSIRQKFVDKIFKNYEFSPVNRDGTFTLTVDDNFFFPKINGLSNLISVVDFDDESGKITYKVDDRIIFLTRQEFKKIRIGRTNILSGELLLNLISVEYAEHLAKEASPEKKMMLNKICEFTNSSIGMIIKSAENNKIIQAYRKQLKIFMD